MSSFCMGWAILYTLLQLAKLACNLQANFPITSWSECYAVSLMSERSRPVEGFGDGMYIGKLNQKFGS